MATTPRPVIDSVVRSVCGRDDAADTGWVPAFAIGRALEVLGWKNPASPTRLQRCVDVIARYAGA